MNEQKPTVGRIVHYQSHGSPNGQHKSAPRAAIITGTDVSPLPGDVPGMQRVNLCVLNPTGMYFDQGTPFSEEPKPGCWNWPPRT